MIVRKRPGTSGMFFLIRGSLIQQIWQQVMEVGLLSGVVVAAHRYAPHLVPGVNTASFALLGIALSIFLSFRNGANFDRWWEARKLWGQIIQTARDIARQTVVLGETEERKVILMAVADFARRAERQLRQEPQSPTADVPGWLTPLMTALVAYTFFGLDALGETSLPAPPVPVGYVLT